MLISTYRALAGSTAGEHHAKRNKQGREDAPKQSALARNIAQIPTEKKYHEIAAMQERKAVAKIDTMA